MLAEITVQEIVSISQKPVDFNSTIGDCCVFLGAETDFGFAYCLSVLGTALQGDGVSKHTSISHRGTHSYQQPVEAARSSSGCADVRPEALGHGAQRELV